jgi:hypothetical protein
MADLGGKIEFFQACLPPLLPGNYSVKIEQTLEQVRPDKPFSTTLEFSVAGPRFSLNPADVYAVYPPANQTGAFGNTLPHIVFTRRTLPWERTLDGTQPDDKNPCPWLALLVCSDADFLGGGWEVPKITARKVGELLAPGESGVKGPDLAVSNLKEYESADDLCNTIDLPAPLFSRIVPARADLPYLAHVRQVNTGNKETLSLRTEGCFAVVLGNRFPETGTAGTTGKNTAYVVSLEGFQRYLYGGPAALQAQKVRLAVLATWSFFCQGDNSFKTLMERLRTGPLMLPVSRVAAAAVPKAASQVKDALEQGYTALDHRVRNGENTVSWYRGPLVPLFYPKLETYPYLPSADAALRYNYHTGLLDASYAAAWQLGRLLALQNTHFARSLYRYRNQERQKTKAAIEHAGLQGKYALSAKPAVEQVVQATRLAVERIGKNGRQPT